MCKMREIFAHTVRNEAYKTHMSRKLYHTDKKHWNALFLKVTF